MRITIFICVLALATAVAGGCSSSDSGSPRTPASVSAQTSVAQEGIVGQAVSAPAVLVLDAAENPVSGVSVSWAVETGGGSVGNPTSTTNANGIASSGSWTLGTTAGLNSLRATVALLGQVTFEASAAPGAASAVTPHAGSGQASLVGQPVPVNPAVRIVDQYGNPRSGVNVTFTVTGGGGQITGAQATSSANGVATVGSWTLGILPGENKLSAAVPGFTAVQFTATGTVSAACEQVAAYAITTVVSGALTASDCLVPSNYYYDFYQTSVTGVQALRFTMQSSDFDAYLFLLDQFGNTLAEDDDAGGGSNSAITFIAAPGTLQMAASSFEQLTLGGYTVSSSLVSGLAQNCTNVFVMRGITTAQNLLANDCVDPSGPFFSDQFIIRLIAGVPFTVRMNSGAFDTYLELWNVSATTPFQVALNDNGPGAGTNSVITLTPQTTAYYAIVASSFSTSVEGAYTLNIDAPTSGSMLLGGDSRRESLLQALRRKGVLRQVR